jgi:glyoxylase-like metal-dependent hydrolase (beta-lactamase superfamily II)
MMKYRVIPVTDYQQNCSLVWCSETNKAALIDPGGDGDILLRAVREEGVQLEKLLLTHGHLDHVGGAKLIAEQLNIPIIGPHQDDAFWLELLPSQAEMFGFRSGGVCAKPLAARG